MNTMNETIETDPEIDQTGDWIAVLVGAEGVAELDGVEWAISLDSEDDAEAFRVANNLTRERWRAVIRDGTGRPYFLTGVGPEAPLDVRARARSSLRVVRLG